MKVNEVKKKIRKGILADITIFTLANKNDKFDLTLRRCILIYFVLT